MQSVNSLNRDYKKALLLMIAHAVLVMLWNITGIVLIAEGKPALGPAASWVGLFLFAILILVYLVLYKEACKRLFLLVVFIGAMFAAMAIYGALTKDPLLWSSEFWRYAGITINLLGVIGFLFTLKLFVKSKR